MAILGKLIKRSISLIHFKSNKKAVTQQKKVLKLLLTTAKYTSFGLKYDFKIVLQNFGYQIIESNKVNQKFYNAFKEHVPIFTYEKIFNDWWKRSLEGQEDITWPGAIPYFALSSGTSESGSKYIPVTKDQLKAIKKTGRKQIYDLVNYNFDSVTFEKSILMLGGSTKLNQINKSKVGDLSGITLSNLPIWIKSHYKPGKLIAEEASWGLKLEKIVAEAPNWDVSFVVGVPAWIQILLEKIIKEYKLNNIHEMWPNLAAFCHGGVSFEPYKPGFEKLLGEPIKYIETYLASEGFIAYQEAPNSIGMKMALNSGIFFEFIPFNDKNFDEEGNLKENPETLLISDTVLNENYALLISTAAGAWRYLIGDTIKFLDKATHEIAITGRTKQFLSLCGEHLSIENMNDAIRKTANTLNINIKEFTVSGTKKSEYAVHDWYIGTDDVVDNALITKTLDDNLKLLNDDYATERLYALKEVNVTVLPERIFYSWMKSQGKEGGQNKFPRVLKTTRLESWQGFVNEHLASQV